MTQTRYLTCTQRKNRRSRLESSLQEMNDGGACLESFKISCVVSKLNVYFFFDLILYNLSVTQGRVFLG